MVLVFRLIRRLMITVNCLQRLRDKLCFPCPANLTAQMERLHELLFSVKFLSQILSPSSMAVTPQSLLDSKSATILQVSSDLLLVLLLHQHHQQFSSKTSPSTF